jgi:hypothetical protein
MAQIYSRTVKLELLDGKTVELTLNFKMLLYLRANGYDAEVSTAMKAINGNKLDFLEMPAVFYAAYLCALPMGEKPAYTNEEFVGLVPFDMQKVGEVFAFLISEKKTALS